MINSQMVFWNFSVSKVLKILNTSLQGLSEEEAHKRLRFYGPNLLRPKKKRGTLTLLFSQFKSPIILILVFAAAVSFFVEDRVDAIIILLIIAISALLSFWQEKGANRAVEKLLTMVKVRVNVLRNGILREISIEDVVPGDIVFLKAGDIVPGDSLLIESKDLFVNEATLTGETYPVEKQVGILSPETPLSQRTNVLYLGTYVVSGSAKAVVVRTGKETEFGKVAKHLTLRPPLTDFERGVRRFGYFLMEVTFILIVIIFGVNVYFKRPTLDSLLFALALAVGMTPQLLPAIITINLSHGAKHLAKKKVIVKRLASIENFGSMNVFCSDKTGTLTEGVVKLHSALDIYGKESNKVFLYAYINAIYETGFLNPLDEAIRNYQKVDITSYQKLDEVPYDFIRKRLSVLVSKEGKNIIITKGALRNVLEVCSAAEIEEGKIVEIEKLRDKIQKTFENLSEQGFRVLGIAYKEVNLFSISKDDEVDMTFLGFLVFFDPPKPGILETISELRKLGISFKIITGDNHLVARSLTKYLGIPNPLILTGQDLHKMSDEALLKLAPEIDIFAEVEPNQKERIILALKKAGYVVGYMGDGINDASAIYAADVGISVEGAAAVAKEAADIVLLEKDLNILINGVQEGRKTFANTMKYIFMATSANFGNMFSMAGASLFLPFLPLLPKQVLLTNLLTDLPEMAIATDNVDPEMLEKPQRWNMSFIRKFMIVFGPLSSVFDYLTFGVLLLVLKATVNQFRTGWFLESVISASLIVLVIRSKRPFFKSKPGKYLFTVTLITVAITFILPFTLIGELFNFTLLPLHFYLFLGIILASYIISAEIVKKFFWK
ncbi:MAG: magnesium-translocating P-type ATPase [Thermodesulfobacterium geofontis]|uniref:Magnesium-transporting ATPase, P-type 1 n=3 Tax=Thermodesulfobacterium geofontis TaxID=1295609 RepID=A0A2N7PMN6_9BACT|nr:MAG: magnesium-translocating P-type ATPase [Thermodesulfobacterium geofontis]